MRVPLVIMGLAGGLRNDRSSGGIQVGQLQRYLPLTFTLVMSHCNWPTPVTPARNCKTNVMGSSPLFGRCPLRLTYFIPANEAVQSKIAYLFHLSWAAPLQSDLMQCQAHIVISAAHKYDVCVLG